jgi:PAS domain S-box-containing protein
MERPPQEVPGESVEELFENAPCGYLTTAADGTILRVNRTLLAWLGYEYRALVGKRRFVDLLTMPGKVFHETHYVPLLRMQGFAHEIALDFVARDGSRLPTLVNATLVRDQDGKPWYVRTSVFNATDRRKYERELLIERRKAEQGAKVKAEFLATASHEIRNQLHSIAAVTQLFVMGPKAADHARYLHQLEASCSSLLSLVNDILDYSKLEAGKMALEERPFNVRDVVHAVVSSVQARVEIAHLLLRVDIDERVPSLLLGDAIKLSQVLTNLCGNAIKFTARGTIRIAVRLREQGPERATLSFSVSDTGAGIPAPELASICKEFTASSRHTSVHERSTGLGLSICQRLLALHGSTLCVESKVGEGSTFSFELSLPTVLLPESHKLLGELMAKHTLDGIRVLVAMEDDEPGEVHTLQLTRLLERWGADFELVDSGERVVDRVKHAPYDLVLMDAHLAGRDEGRCTRMIRALPNQDPATLPIIALGSVVEPGQRERLTSAGFTDFLGKPFESDLLFRSIALHASIHRALTRH